MNIHECLKDHGVTVEQVQQIADLYQWLGAEEISIIFLGWLKYRIDSMAIQRIVNFAESDEKKAAAYGMTLTELYFFKKVWSEYKIGGRIVAAVISSARQRNIIN